MKASPNGRAFLTMEEGKRRRAYRDTRGIWTIGVGHTSMAGPPAVYEGLTLTDAEIDAVLDRDLAPAEALVNSLVKVPLNQNEFDSLISLIHNIGPAGFKRSSVLRLLNAGNRAGAADAFLMWKKAGADLDILLPRRKRERKFFLTPVLGQLAQSTPPPPAPAKPAKQSWLSWLIERFK